MPALSGGTVSLPVHPDTNGFGKKLSSGVMGESGVIGGLGKHLGGLIVGGLAVAGIGASIGSIVSKGLEEVKGNSATLAQLTAGIKSTGGAAGVTTNDMLGLAKSIEEYSGQSHGSIGAAEKLLLTFTNIKNVGPDKIFDQATKAAADMAAKFGGDAAGQSILLGKALNDPVRGITALTRVGVAFSTGQREQIKAMQDSGNTMGAQKIILAELTKEFGGAAEAAGNSLPGQIEKSKRAFEAFSGAAVGVLVPILVPAISLITKGLNAITPVVDKISDSFGERLTPVISRVGAATKGLFDLFVKGDFTGGLGKALGITEDSPIVGIIFSIRDGVIGAFGKIMEAGRPIFDAIGAGFKQLWPTIAPLIPQIMSLAMALSPVRLIFEALGPVIPSLVGMLGQLASTLAGALGTALTSLMPVVTQLAGIIAGELVKIVMTLIPVIVELVGVIGPVLGQVLTAVAPLIALVGTYIGQLLEAVLPLIQPVLALVMAFLPLLSPLLQLVGSILTPLIKLLTAVMGPVTGLAVGLVKLLVPAVVLIGNIMASVFGGIGQIIMGAFTGVVGFVKGIFNTVINLVNGIIRGINGIPGAVKIMTLGALDKFPLLPKLADSGTVLPTPGGTIVRVAEGGKAESVVDTGKLNKLMDAAGSGRGSSLPENITLVDADGSIMARTHVIARQVTTRTMNQTLRGLA